MKISGSFLTMLLFWILGFTHVLGGPYLFFKIIFWLALLPFFIAIFVFILMLFKVKKISQINTQSQNQETIHVDVEVRE
jgi:hypothetical protein